MLIVRAAQENDLESLLALAAQVGTGMTSLKPDRAMLSKRLDVACASFASQIAPMRADYLFVMEDTSCNRLAGVCAIRAAVGLDEPFYNYRIGTVVHSSRELQIFTRMETLYLSNDLTGYTELCSLFLHPDYRNGNNGKLLSKSRLLFIAQFPHLFAEKVIAEMRGYQSAEGVSPFYEGLGRHFFKMDFSRADDLTSLGKKSFIAELMPSQPMYVAYLPQEAQQAIGKVHLNTAPARHMLEQEGLHFEGYVDIFDAGPVLQARISALRAMHESAVKIIDSAPSLLDVDPTASDSTTSDPSAMRPLLPASHPVLVSNTALAHFRIILSQTVASALSSLSTLSTDSIFLSAQEKNLLDCQTGDPVRTLPLNPKREAHA